MNLALSPGKTMGGIFNGLRVLHSRGELTFENVVFWHMDEFIGLDSGDERTQRSRMYKELYDTCGIPASQVRYLNPWPNGDEGGGEVLMEEVCDRYEESIKQAGGLDLTILSTGADGHIARNEPGSSLSGLSRRSALAYDTRSQIATRWSVPLSSVPALALTMGVATIHASKNVIVLFVGLSRSHTLQQFLEGSINHMNPVTTFQRHTSCTVIADELSTYELRMKTVHYFKQIEQTSREISSTPLHGNMSY